MPFQHPAKQQPVRSEFRSIATLLFGFVALLWGLEFVDTAVFGGGLDAFGIEPRTASGLFGILAAPLLHGDFAHLLSNTFGLVILGGLTLAVGRHEFKVTTLFGVLLGGLGVWVFGRSAVHLGASGLIFSYLGFLMLRGWYERRVGPVVLSVLVGWFHAGMLLGMVPGITPSNISWEGHLFGFIAGGVAARVLYRRAEKNKRAQRSVAA